MPCFAINTKLGTAMIDTLGGAEQVNNLLAALNLKTISNSNLKKMENRAGDAIVSLSEDLSRQAAQEAFTLEMRDIAEMESAEVEQNIEGLVEDLGVSALPDASPSVRLCIESLNDKEHDWTDIEDERSTEDNVQVDKSSSRKSRSKQRCSFTPSSHKRSRVRLSQRFPCKTRSGISCAVDTAWQKRGFDSLTSHTFFMSKSKYGKKVLKTLVSHRTCSVCNWWRRNRPGLPVRSHHCVRNHTGSARSMEGFSGVKGVKSLTNEGTPIEYLEGDGDTTLIAKLRNDLNINMKKRFDKNHVVKNIGKSLYALRSEKDVKLSKAVISHIEKCVKYAFAKNQGNVEGLRANLKALIPHQFGDHSICDAFFCNFKRTPNCHYINRSLPYKVPLKDISLRDRLQHIMDPIISNAEQYSDLGSSQQCEHANKEVSLRAPKSHHYGGTQSLDYRVHASAAFVNEGRMYVSQGYARMGLSPGNNSVKFYEKGLKRRMLRRAQASLPSVKRRRLILKQERAITQGAQESLEGSSYQSGIGHEKNPDVDQLPDAVPRGNFKQVQLSEGKPSIIAFDLETTDLIRGGVMPHITQIAATNMETGDNFNVYVQPDYPIAAEAQRITGISFNDSTMRVHGVEVGSYKIRSALDQLCVWLSKFTNVCLVAHNGRRFDFPVLMNALIINNYKEKFFTCVSSLCDSLAVFRKYYPKECLKQDSLVKNLLALTYDAHNAIADVENLGKLINYTLDKTKSIMEFTFSPEAVLFNMLNSRQKNLNIRSLDILVAKGVCKRPTAENIAGSGLNFEHLKTIYLRSGEDGLRDVFTEKNSEGQPRVTSVQKTLDEVVSKLGDLFNVDKVGGEISPR